MYLSILYTPLISALIGGLLGRKLGGKGAGFVTTTCIIFTNFLSILALIEVGFNGTPVNSSICPWFLSDLLTTSWQLLFDTLTVVMLVVITFISSLVHLYSLEYMKEDPHLPRFMSYLSLFTFFMIILVTANNFVQMFVGWEGVGLCSYLLINFWFTRIQANKAAIKAMLVNRIADVGLALGLFAIYKLFNTLDYATVFALTPSFETSTFFFFNVEVHALTLIGILLFVGAVGKSAQLGLHTWLPDAMEGPTPVSALIHAATMVTAGVFLLARCSIILEYAPYALNIIAFFGAMTAFFAASVGLVQNDLKRVIAYSTCSQLGYMIFACGLSNFNVAVFHLANHAFFKALLFLGAGSIIHAVADEQDMRKTGGLRKLLPFTYGMMMIGSLSLMGFPFLTGFYSKDVILEVAYAGFSIPGHFAYWLGTVGAFFTAFYSIRLIYLTFLIDSSAHRKTIVGVHESPWKMTIPLFILSIPSIFIGYYSKDMMIGFGSLFWGNAITIHPSHFTLVDSEFIPTLFKLLPVTLSCIGAGLSFFLYNSNYRVLYLIKISLFGKKIYKFLNRKWYFDKVYNECINQNLLTFSYNTTFKSIDRGILELMGPMGVSIVTQKTSELLQKAQNGNFFDYSTWFLGSITLIVTVWSYLNWEISYSLLMLDTLDHRCVLFLLFFFVIFDQGKKNK